MAIWRAGGGNWARMVLAGAAAIALVAIAYRLSRDAPPPQPQPAASVPADAAADPEARIRALQERVGANPADAEGWQLLGAAYFDGERYADAARAYRRAADRQPANATFQSSLGEALVMASERDPMPADALAAFRKAVALDARDPRARYFLAVKRDLDGDHAGAIGDWLALLADTPPGAPWELDLRRTIEQVAKINRIDVAARLAAARPATPHPAMTAPAPGSKGASTVASVAAAAIPGPTAEQMAAARSLTPAQQQSMADGMVASLEAKLAADPANVDGWIILMRSRMTLGQGARAAAALKQASAANPAGAARLREAARLLGVPGV